MLAKRAWDASREIAFDLIMFLIVSFNGSVVGGTAERSEVVPGAFGHTFFGLASHANAANSPRGETSSSPSPTKR